MGPVAIASSHAWWTQPASQAAPAEEAWLLHFRFSGLCAPTSLSVLFHFLYRLAGVSRTLVPRVHVGLVDGDEGLLDIILHCGDRRADGLATKAMSYQAEMRQTVLYVRLQDRGGSAVPVGCSILMEEVSEFLAHLPVKTVGECDPVLDKIIPHPQSY